jgi:hypothetical protein
VGNAFQGLALAVHLEHSSNCGRLALDDFEFHAVQIPDAAIAEHAAAGVKRFKGAALHPAVGLLAKLTRIHAVDQPVHTEEDFSLGTVRVDALRYGHQTDTRERQALVQVERIGQLPGESRGVVDENCAERASTLLGCGKEPLKTGPLRTRAAYRVVRENAVFEHGPALTLRVLAALPNLIFDGDGGLTIAAEAGVDGAAKDHGVTSADGLLICWNSATREGCFAICFASRSARYSRASAGMITLSAHSRNAGGSFAPSFSLSVTHRLSFSFHDYGFPDGRPGRGSLHAAASGLKIMRSRSALSRGGFSRIPWSDSFALVPVLYQQLAQFPR